MAIKVNSDTKSLKFQKKRLWVQYTSHIFRAYMKKPSRLGTSFLRTVGIRMEWYGSFDSPDTPPNCKTKRALALTAKAFHRCGGGIWTSRPPGYEPDELPDCSTPRYIGAGNRDRTGTILSYHGILSPGRLPVPPFRRTRDLGTHSPVRLIIISQPLHLVNPFW